MLRNKIKRKIKHIAVIPARAGSSGFPKKNQIFFDNTARFLKKIKWFDKIIVNSNDPIVLNKAINYKFNLYKRLDKLSGPKISIKTVFQDLISSLKLKEDIIFWLFYLPILYKNNNDFKKAKKIIEKKNIKSLCTFVPTKTHPLNTWKYDKKLKKLSQYINNNVYRRQDLTPAWMHYHYVCCFKSRELKNLNHELINAKTHPLFLSNEYSKNLVEIDSPEDLKKWKKANINI